MALGHSPDTGSGKHGGVLHPVPRGKKIYIIVKSRLHPMCPPGHQQGLFCSLEIWSSTESTASAHIAESRLLRNGQPGKYLTHTLCQSRRPFGPVQRLFRPAFLLSEGIIL